MLKRFLLVASCVMGLGALVALALVQVLATTTFAGSLPSPLQQDTPPAPFLHPP